MKNINDKDLLNVILDGHKLSASSLTNLVLESADTSLRNDVTNILNGTFKHQKQLFDYMSQKGWYQTQSASQQDISRVQQQVNSVGQY